MSPRKPPPEEDDDEVIPVLPPRLPQEVLSAWDRKRRKIQSKKDAALMWAPILEGYRSYADTLIYVHVIEDLGR